MPIPRFPLLLLPQAATALIPSALTSNLSSTSLIPMRFLVSLCLWLLLMATTSFAFADAFVCTNQQGKKIFSSESCEKKGMKAASVDFPVKSGQAISAVVIAPQVMSSDNVILPGGTVVKKREPGEWPLEKPVVYFLMTMLVAMGALFSLIFFRFFKAHHRKLSLDR